LGQSWCWAARWKKGERERPRLGAGFRG
jgi:hypothetical protein